MTVLIPPSHNWSPASDVVCPVVCATNLVFVDVGEYHFDQFGIRAVIVLNGAIERIHAYQASLDIRTLQRPVPKEWLTHLR